MAEAAAGQVRALVWAQQQIDAGEGVINMGKNSSKGSGTGRSGSGGKGSSGYGRGVSQARLGQKTGSSNAFGGWAKVQKPNGDFRMRPSK